MRLRAATLTAAMVCVVACQQSPPPDPSNLPTIRNKPPQRQDVIKAVLASGNIPLTVHSSCNNVGANPADATISEYLGGFLAAMDKPDEKNWIETRIVEAQGAAGASVWRCELTLRHSAGDDEWGWGVRFDIDRENGRILRSSFNCIGAG